MGKVKARQLELKQVIEEAQFELKELEMEEQNCDHKDREEIIDIGRKIANSLGLNIPDKLLNSMYENSCNKVKTEHEEIQKSINNMNTNGIGEILTVDDILNDTYKEKRQDTEEYPEEDITEEDDSCHFCDNTATAILEIETEDTGSIFNVCNEHAPVSKKDLVKVLELTSINPEDVQKYSCYPINTEKVDFVEYSVNNTKEIIGAVEGVDKGNEIVLVKRQGNLFKMDRSAFYHQCTKVEFRKEQTISDEWKEIVNTIDIVDDSIANKLETLIKSQIVQSITNRDISNAKNILALVSALKIVSDE